MWTSPDISLLIQTTRSFVLVRSDKPFLLFNPRVSELQYLVWWRALLSSEIMFKREGEKKVFFIFSRFYRHSLSFLPPENNSFPKRFQASNYTRTNKQHVKKKKKKSNQRLQIKPKSGSGLNTKTKPQCKPKIFYLLSRSTATE